LVALLTGGSDKPYALGLASALAAQGVTIEFVGSDELDCPEVRTIPRLRFLNLRGSQREDAGMFAKTLRVAAYYGKLALFVATTRATVIHVLWNNKFEIVDRTVLMAFYRLLGKRIVFTAHNINAAERDGGDGWINRASLRIQYRLSHHVFVHTDRMKRDLAADYGIATSKIGVIPFGINSMVPTTGLSRAQAKRKLGLPVSDLTLLFFGHIAPYKGLEYLVAAVAILATGHPELRLVIAGKVRRGDEGYWRGVQDLITEKRIEHMVVTHIGFIPDEQVEYYFKAADVAVLPYLHIFQSGVAFLAFNFGVPVIATDVGSLREDVVAQTGFLCQPADSFDLARAISQFCESASSWEPDAQRERIRQFVQQKHSWATVAERTKAVYLTLVGGRRLSSLVSAGSGSPEDGCRESADF
jgi:glycosyltransferase involved in cell wall biosynthesis